MRASIRVAAVRGVGRHQDVLDGAFASPVHLRRRGGFARKSGMRVGWTFDRAMRIGVYTADRTASKKLAFHFSADFLFISCLASRRSVSCSPGVRLMLMLGLWVLAPSS